MTDIWDEKPKSSDEFTCGCWRGGELYDADEINPWLEKLRLYYHFDEKIIEKAEKYDRYVKHVASLEEYGVWGSINRLDDKIETIKKLTEPFIEWGGPHEAFYRVRLHKHPELQEYVSELMKVLYPDVQSPEVKTQ